MHALDFQVAFKFQKINLSFSTDLLKIDDHRTLVEPSCGASLAVAYNLKEKVPEKVYKNVVVIVCGGSGINLKQLISLGQI